MNSIIKKELQQYFATMTGYVFLVALVLVSALIFVQSNLFTGSSDYSITLFSTLSIFLVLIPLLTMRLFAEEVRQKTDQLIFTAPVKISSIVLGKFISAIIVFLIGFSITLTFPILLNIYGEVITPVLLSSILGYILLICCFIAVGVFISSLTDNQITAAALTFATIFLFFILDTILPSLPVASMSTFIFLFFTSIVLAVIMYDSTKSKKFSIIVFTILVIINALVYFINPMFYDNGIYKILSWFSLLGRFEGFVIGIISLSDVLYYISFIVFFIYLTISNLEKRRWK